MLDEEKVPLRAGDFLVKRDTNCAWFNRSGEPWRALCVRIDGRLDSESAPLFAALFAAFFAA